MLKHLIYILAISMVPVIELRGAIPVGVGLGVPFWAVFVTALIGNLLPIPILILFTTRIFAWLRKKSAFLERLVSRGTGAWTGALVSAVFGIDLKHAMPAIALGVLIAGIIVSVITYGVSIFL